MFTIYCADTLGSPVNRSYPHRCGIENEEELRHAVSHDYVCAQYRGGCRSIDNFICSDVLAVDCDNDHSDDPADWVTPDDVAAAFPGVSFAVHYSRSHMKEKNGRAARPKFHILFPMPEMSGAEAYAGLKKTACRIFPFFDRNALDAARFFFGTPEPQVEIRGGFTDIADFIAGEGDLDGDDKEPDILAAPDQPLRAPYGEAAETHTGRAAAALPRSGAGSGLPSIPEGRRNATLSRLAVRFLKRCGEGDTARGLFDAAAARCVPPLPARELGQIWAGALRFYGKLSAQPGYIQPAEYKKRETGLRPTDFSDVAQAQLLAERFGSVLRYCAATGYLRYSGGIWHESDTAAQAAAQELTDLQLAEARALLRAAREEVSACGAQKMLDMSMRSRPGMCMSSGQEKAVRECREAQEYLDYVIKRRGSIYIAASLHEARPLLNVSDSELNADCFALCTPGATYDLRRGLEGAREHDPGDMITKMTAVDPGDRGRDIWQDCLNKIFGGDEELIAYVQLICGLAAIGKVFVEALIIAWGSGRNGKSTFWNTVSRVLGSYSGKISADTLTAGCRRNIKPELAEVNGKRLLIAAELGEGQRLNDSTVKQLCSTDEIYAEKKYRDPFSFTPCHTLVLYTNHLPKVGALDDGIWRRLIVIPFSNRIEGGEDVKNYAEYLYRNAAPAVLAWIIEGARRIIELGYRLEAPACVENAGASYRDTNDWFSRFVEDSCTTGEGLTESSGALYKAYRQWCEDNGEYTRSTADFYAALENAGYKRTDVRRIKHVIGLKLGTDSSTSDDMNF